MKGALESPPFTLLWLRPWRALPPRPWSGSLLIHRASVRNARLTSAELDEYKAEDQQGGCSLNHRAS